MNGQADDRTASDILVTGGQVRDIAPQGSLPRRSRVQMLLALLLTALLAFGTVYPLSARASSGYTNDEGVDTCDYPTSGDLNALWSGTPFFDYGWYLGGVNAKDYALCAPWTSSTLSTARSLGWGFTPLWDDLRAPRGAGRSMEIRPRATTSGHWRR